MKSILYSLNPHQFYDTSQAKPTLLLLGSAFILILHKYFGSMEFFLTSFPQHNSTAAAIFMFVSAFLLLGVIPVLIIKIFFKQTLKQYGLQLGRWKEGLAMVLILFVPICVILLIPSSQTAEMVHFYPFDKSIVDSPSQFLLHELLRGIFFYSSWEFFFRGFLLFGLRPFVGNWISICIQTIPSCLWHIGMPTGEIFGSIAGGLLFGLMALRTQSIIWPFVLHVLIGVALDFFIVITH
jgi:membrane protease YdiL (CAAX protease family)